MHAVAAMDPDGNSVIAWNSYGQDGSSHGVFAQGFANTGTRVGDEFRVNTFTDKDQAWPFVAMDPHGNFVVTWNSYEQDGSGWGVYEQRFKPTLSDLIQAVKAFAMPAC